MRGFSVFKRSFEGFILLCLALNGYAIADMIDGEELIDPTRPLFFARSGGQGLAMSDLSRNVIPASYDVTFVRANGASPIAVINQQRVTIGDVVDGAIVVAIDRGGVTLSVNAQERRISLTSIDIKSPVTAC